MELGFVVESYMFNAPFMERTQSSVVNKPTNRGQALGSIPRLFRFQKNYTHWLITQLTLVQLPLDQTHWMIMQFTLVHYPLDKTQILKMNRYWNQAYIAH